MSIDRELTSPHCLITFSVRLRVTHQYKYKSLVVSFFFTTATFAGSSLVKNYSRDQLFLESQALLEHRHITRPRGGVSSNVQRREYVFSIAAWGIAKL